MTGTDFDKEMADCMAWLAEQERPLREWMAEQDAKDAELLRDIEGLLTQDTKEPNGTQSIFRTAL